MHAHDDRPERRVAAGGQVPCGGCREDAEGDAQRILLLTPFDDGLNAMLREFLAGPGRATGEGPPLPIFRGQGVQPGVDLTDNAALEELMDAKP